MTNESIEHEEGRQPCPRMEAIARSRFGASAVHLMARAAQSALASSSDAIGVCGLTTRQLAVLDAVATVAPITQHELSALIGVDRSSLVALIDSLEGCGLLVREAHATDRRAHALAVTPAGRSRADEALCKLNEAELALLACLTEPEQAMLKDFLRRIAAREEILGRAKRPDDDKARTGEPAAHE